MAERWQLGFGIVRLVLLALVATITLLIVMCGLYWTKGVYVRITNGTESALQQVDIIYQGRAVHIGRIEPKASCGRYVNPPGESGLKMEWLNSSGVKQSYTDEVYIEHNYSGSVRITVDPNDQVQVVNNIRMRFLWP